LANKFVAHEWLKNKFVAHKSPKMIDKVSWHPACCRAAHNLPAKLTHSLLAGAQGARLPLAPPISEQTI